MGCDCHKNVSILVHVRFNPRTRMGCDALLCIFYIGNLCFNPRTRMGCDCTGSIQLHDSAVSIHAPAWGATKLLVKKIIHILVSIHAPAWGATVDGRLPYMSLAVSIHAPAWGATGILSKRHTRGYVSIHAPAWGATFRFKMNLLGIVSFNPRTRMGCDLLCVWFFKSLNCFNPRTRMGCDPGAD